MGKNKYRYQCVRKRKRSNILATQIAREARMKKRENQENIAPSTSSNIVLPATMAVGDCQHETTLNNHYESDTSMNATTSCNASLNEEYAHEGIVNDTVLEVSMNDIFVEESVATCDENDICSDIEGRRIIDFRFFMDQLKTIDAHSQKFGCRFSQLKFLKEMRSGLISKFYIKCSMCGTTFNLKTSEEIDNIDVNSCAVSGAIITGIGHSNLNELVASIGLPTLPFRLYRKCHEDVAEMWKNAAEDTMVKAAEEEAEAAKIRGDVNDAGIPTISVQADACWSKRSYKSNYSALSGVAAIIGESSGKVLHIGVRNKYCVICIRDRKRGIAPRTHDCRKNHSGSSTSMEQSILVEGFKKSITERNLIYKTLIADGDSSTYKNILESRPYPDVPIQKIECTNHLLRNYNGKNLKLLTDTSIPNSERKLLTVDRQTRLRTAIRSAIKFRRSENVTDAQKIQNIQKDILNSPRHVFGDHSECENYYCTEERKREINLTEQTPTLILRLQKNAAQLSHNSRSLLHCATNNRAEQFNSIVAKLVGGKRVNFSLKNSYEARCYAAVVAFNTGKPHYTMYKCNLQRSPSKFLKHLESRRHVSNKRRLTKRTKRSARKINFGHADYGDKCQRPDMNIEEYENSKTLFLKSLENQAANRHEIERATILQAESALWLELRRCILTASMFAKICKRRPNQNSSRLVKTILYSYNLDHVPSIKHGKVNESVALEQLSKQENITVEKCGLFIDPDHCYLGASPDGLCGDELIEVKCPISAFGMDFDTAVRTKKVKGFKISDISVVTLNENHDWFYQIQGQLNIANKNICILAIWTGSEFPIKLIRIEKNIHIWQEKMLPKLQAFYNQCMLPEIIDPRKSRSMPLREIFL